MSRGQKIFTDEKILLASLRAGDSAAVEYWYRQYSARLTAFIQAKVGSTHDVQDLAQETFICCLQNLHNFSGHSRLWTWMCAIAKHEVADYYRKLYAKKVLKLLPLSDFLTQVELYDSTELAEKLEYVWQKIGAHYKELLLEKYLDKHQVKEMARARGKTVKTIESELWRARQAFKSAYRELED